MIELEVPVVDAQRRVRWVQVTIRNGVVTCTDEAVRRKVERLKPPGGFPTDVPEPDWALGDLCRTFLAARITRKEPNGTDLDTDAGVLP